MKDRDLYSCVAPFYDCLSTIWSFNQINKSKRAAFNREYLPPGSSVLIVGAGTGKEAIDCATRFPDVRVTVVDISNSMLQQFNKRRKMMIPDAKNIKSVQADFLRFHGQEGGYDMVIFNYFLNVFDEKMVNNFIEHSLLLVKPDAYIVIGDWCKPSKDSSIMKKIIVNTNWWGATLFFKMICTGNTIHHIWDYIKIMEEKGCTVMERKLFPWLFCDTYQCIIMKKKTVANT